MSNLQQFVFNDQSVRVVSIEGDPWFVAQDVLSAIKSTTTVTAAKTVIGSDLGKGFVGRVPVLTSGGLQEVLVLHQMGVSVLLSKSRKSLALDLAKALNLPSAITHSKQSKTISIIRNAFIHLNPIEEFFISGYRIDLYFPSYRLAVECDEIHHQNQRQHDKARQDAITRLLGCSWVRYCPEAKDFCVGKVVNQILMRVSR